jgi:hypothetical protein
MSQAFFCPAHNLWKYDLTTYQTNIVAIERVSRDLDFAANGAFRGTEKNPAGDEVGNFMKY